ncbi:MAG: hypothetical protein ORO03_00880 [Alphaproteobacteria bacterium]|nr:hypothetical protein [Alphaproteobacteria bacterium]
MTRILTQIQNSFRKMVAAELHDELTEKKEEEIKKFGKAPSLEAIKRGLEDRPLQATTA